MRHEYNLSHEYKTSVDMGQLIPVMCEEVLPGDTFLHRATALTRVAPLANPLMHRVELRMHSFYCPNRVAWNAIEKEEVDDQGPFIQPFRFEDFITGEDPNMTPPFAAIDDSMPLWDYFGLKPTGSVDVDWTPAVIFNMIYNEYYRDQDLQQKRTLIDTSIPRCAWQKDYFTIARPSPQQGEPERIPVQSGALPIHAAGVETVGSLNVPGQSAAPPIDGGTGRYRFDQLEAFDSNATMLMNIDDLRRSIALQRFAEARMRYGDRYIDYLRYLGINPSDGRLDRPEYLGGGKEILNFSEVLQTAPDASSNVGDMYGHGIGLGRSNGFRKMFEEHGWVLTLLSIRPKTVYQDALPRKFTRETFEDYWQKELEVLPWQEVKQREVDINGSADTVFGYVPRYEEYRFGTSMVTGSLRDGTEQDWHMARNFQSPPTLNGSFVECTPTDRIYQDTNMPECILNIMHSLKARRLVGSSQSMGVSL